MPATALTARPCRARCLALVAIATTLPAAAQVQFTRLTRPANARFASAQEVSADGEWVAGYAGFPAAILEEQAILWNPAGVPTKLGDVPGGLLISRAVAVSNGPDPLVSCSGIEESVGRPFTWRASTGIVPVPMPTYSYLSISDAAADGSVFACEGQAVGSLAPITVHRVIAATGQIIDLGIPAQATGNAEVYATSTDASAIVGHAGAPAPQQWIAYLWTQAEGFTSLGILAAFPDYSTTARAVSDSATIVAGDANQFTLHVPFRWTRWGGMMQLGPAGTPQDMTPDGNIIVGFNGNHGLLWDRRHGTRTLRAAMTQANGGVDPTAASGATILRPRAISPDGRVIVGDAYFSGETDAFVAIMPRPCWADVTTTAVPGAAGYGVPNGVINNDDFFYFLARFVEGDLFAADITTTALPGHAGFATPNGVINNDDFFYFLSLFAAGC